MTLRRAAFGDEPELTPITVPEAPLERWYAAVTLGGQGRYARAAGLLRPLAVGPDPLLGGLAATSMAAHLRQLGGHAAARPLDALAVRRLAGAPPGDRTDPDGLDRAGALADALLGLAADAVGVGTVGAARRLHAAARRALDDRAEPPWRVTVRIDWVAAEIELAAGQPGRAVPFAERALGRATAAGAVRHCVKSTLVLGATLAAGGTPDGRRRALGLLSEALTVSLTRGMFPLAWPAALLLVELVPELAADHNKIIVDALTSIFSHSDAAMRRIAVTSPWVPGRLIGVTDPTRTGVELTT